MHVDEVRLLGSLLCNSGLKQKPAAIPATCGGCVSPRAHDCRLETGQQPAGSRTSGSEARLNSDQNGAGGALPLAGLATPEYTSRQLGAKRCAGQCLGLPNRNVRSTLWEYQKPLAIQNTSQGSACSTQV